jgi:type IV pilus assembly protein PilO
MRFGAREFVLILILLAMPLSSYWLLFRPQNNDIEQARREIAMKRDLLDTLKQATSENENLEAVNEKIRANIEAIEARLPTNKEVDQVVRRVSDLAVESGLEAPLMRSDRPIRAALYMEQPLDMTIRGDFRGFYEFLIKIEQLPRITRVPDLKIRRHEEVDGHMRAEFRLSIYFQEEGV